ncbi:MAG: DUF192 domain-containing protein [Coriobacteriales bacterium]|jgi:hypothetical protein|nr:DUF192 domain-containing protein [Coriobacteriales bacterium]
MQWKKDDIRLATTLRERLLGLLPNNVCSSGEILMLVPCRSVHTLGMRQSLDIALLDKRMQVLRSYRKVKGIKVFGHPKATAVLERRASDAPWFRGGDTLSISAKTRRR